MTEQAFSNDGTGIAFTHAVLTGPELELTYMIHKSFRLTLVLLASLAAAPAISIPITGEVEVRGFVTTDSGDLENATSLCADGRAVGGTGSFAPIDGQSVPMAYSCLAFASALTQPLNPLWSFVFQGTNYSFVLDEVGVVEQSASSLILSGSGTLMIDGYEPTASSWELSSSLRGAYFKFVSQTANVPEPGTLALLGLGLLGIGLGRRRARR